MFPHLPLLSLIERCAKKLHLNCSLLVGGQHLLTETGCLLESIARFGICRENIEILGKPYSSNPKVAERLASIGFHAEIPEGTWLRGYYSKFFTTAVARKIRVFENVTLNSPTDIQIVLDDGGFCLAQMAKRIRKNPVVVGIEQTTSGLTQIGRGKFAFPVISVATSCAKQLIEPAIVLRAVENKLAKRLKGFRSQKHVGVIGLGSIGSRIARGFLEKGAQLFVYDKNLDVMRRFLSGNKTAIPCGNASSVVENAEMIFGCAGFETLPRGCWTKLGTGQKILVSCSSGDIEFQALLRYGRGKPQDPADPFSPVDFQFKDLALRILEGGFPITFDRVPISAPLAEMQMTRALLLGAVIQAVVCADKRRSRNGRLEMLHPVIQKFVVNQWVKLNPNRRKDYSPEILARFQDEEWIRENSEGTFLEDHRLRAMFELQSKTSGKRREPVQKTIQNPTLGALGSQFRDWVNLRRGVSPLYETIVEQLVKDTELLKLVAEAGNREYMPNRFMAAVHFLLLEGKKHPLANHYPTITSNPAPVSDAYRHFRKFCFLYKNDILPLTEREIQINEVRRSAGLLPALARISRREDNRPFALLDIGCSAGFNLLPDYYFYNFGPAGTVGSSTATVKISCKPRGSILPPVPQKMPTITWRLGIDCSPIHVTDPHSTNWLVALVSPDDKPRLMFLRAALDVARQNPLQIIKGKANDKLPFALAQAPQEVTLCLFHCFTTHHFDERELKQFAEILNDFAKQRDFHLISMEWERINGQSQRNRPVPIKLTSFVDGQARTEIVARLDNRGGCEWLEWLRADHHSSVKSNSPEKSRTIYRRTSS